jgi:hypothetical protein
VLRIPGIVISCSTPSRSLSPRHRDRSEATRASAGEWRTVLADDPENARPVILRLLDGRVSFLPVGSGRWRMTGRGTLAGLFSRELFPVGMASPTGFDELYTIKSTDWFAVGRAA